MGSSHLEHLGRLICTKADKEGHWVGPAGKGILHGLVCSMLVGAIETFSLRRW